MTAAQPLPVNRPRLTRSRSDKWIGGICGGIAARYGWDVTLIRVLFVLSLLLPGPQILIYLALWIVIPAEDSQPLPSR